MLRLAAFAIAGALIAARPSSSTVHTHASVKTARAVSDAALRRFEQNDGQFPGTVRFVARTPRGTLVLGTQEAELQLHGATVRMGWRGKAGEIRGIDPLPGVQHYLVGERSRWRRGVPGFGRVKYEGVARGIDLEFYGADAGFEYDVVVHPGAELSGFSLRFDRITKIAEDAGGDLVLSTPAGTIRQHRPIAFQDLDGGRKAVPVRYEIHGDRVAFRADAYDRTRTLVIDPTIGFSTFLGGTSSDRANAVAVDSAGFIYVAGTTSSVDFPTASAMSMGGGGTDAFVSKLTPDGASLVYSTYLGGSGTDDAMSLAVTGSGSAYVAGSTNSTDFPLASAFQTGNANGSGFVSRLAADGGSLVFSTYLGGAGLDRVEGLAIDSSGNAYVTGPTRSADFPLQNAFRTTAGGSFITKFTAAGGVVYSTYFGDPGGTDTATREYRVNLHAIAVDVSGAAYVGGDARGANLPATPGAYRTTLGDGDCEPPPPPRSPPFPVPCLDAVMAKLTPAGALAYATYLRGDAETTVLGHNDTVSGIAVDTTGNAYVVGTTTSQTFPTTPGAIRQTCGFPCGAVRVFVTKLNPAGTDLVYSALLGGVNGLGSGTGVVLADVTVSPRGPAPGIALDALGQAIVTGWTRETDLPAVNAQQPRMGSAAVVRLTGNGTVATPVSMPPGPRIKSVVGGADGTLYALAALFGDRPGPAFTSRDGGATWIELPAPPGGFSDLAIDPNNSTTLYTPGAKSTDGGHTWTPLGQTLRQAPLARPGEPNILFGLGTQGNGPVIKSVDGGASWTSSSTGVPLGVGELFMSPSDSSVMYYFNNTMVYGTTDGGATWTSHAIPIFIGQHLAINPSQPLTLYLTGGGGIWKSVDGGSNWTLTVTGSFLSIIAASSTLVFAAESPKSDVYVSENAGSSWALVGPDVSASAFALDASAPGTVFGIISPVEDGFIAALSETGALVYESYLGGTREDKGWGIATTPDSGIVAVGSTSSRDFPTANALQPANAGSGDAFVTKLRFPQPLMSVDDPVDGATRIEPFRIAGWAVDRGAASDAGIDAIHIWAIPDAGGAATFVAAVAPDKARPDVAAWLGPQFGTSGFIAQVSGLAPGAYTFATFAHSNVTNTFAPPVVRHIRIGSGVLMSIDRPVAGSTTYPGFNIAGWAIDRGSPTDNGVGVVHIWAYPNPGSGQMPIFLGAAATGISRPDVGAIFGSQFANAGYDFAIPPLTPGIYQFAVFPYSSVTNSFGAASTVQVRIADSRPNGFIDTPTNGSTNFGNLYVAGWAIDAAATSGTGVDAVDIWAVPVGGGAAIYFGRANYGATRTDVAAIFGPAFAPCGYSLTNSLPVGTYDIVVYARSTVAGGFNSTRTTRVTITVTRGPG